MKNFFLTIATVLFTFSVFNSCRQQQQKGNEAGLYVPDDLEATLWAESPMFYNPTNMDVDSRGRLWVTEAVNYRNYNNDSTRFLHHPQGDRVMILEDTNHDGKADKSKVFVQDKDLISPVGIAVIGNQVIVSCSPNLIVYTDDNGDDVPDKKEILLTGFGGKDHDHSLHSVTAGPDGNWYFNVGNAGPHMVTDKSGFTLRSGSIYTGGSPYNLNNNGNRKSDDGKVWVGGLALRIKPGGSGLQVLGHNFRNSYEVVTDSYGNLWQNDNDDQVVTCRTTWLMEGGNAGYFSTDGTRTWQADQRPEQDIFVAHWHQEDPGVMPAGDRSGAGAPTGVVMNESDALGKQYLGMLFSADAGRNVIFGYHPSPQQSGYNLGRRDNFITSLAQDNEGYVWNDTAQNKLQEKWFRPSDVTIGTDGAIYVADWYDPVVGGHQMKDSIGYGRIYRIAPRNKKLTTPQIDLSTVGGQVEALKNPAVNVRAAAFEKLRNHGEAVVAPVKALLQDDNPFIRARAVWLLSKLGEAGKKETEALLRGSDNMLKAAAFRALRQAEPDIKPYATQLAADTSAFVRREVAIALRDTPLAAKKDIYLALARAYRPGDRWYLEALGSGMDADAGAWYTLLKNLFAVNGAQLSSKLWGKQMTDFAWRLHPVNAAADIAARAADSTLPAAERKRMLTALAFIKDSKAANNMLSLASSSLPDVKEQALYWLSFRQSNDWFNLLDWSKIAVNTGYERKLAAMKVKRQVVLDKHQSNDERKWRIGEMAADSVGGQLLIGMLADSKLDSFLIAAIQETIFTNPNQAVRVQAGKYIKRKTGKVISIDAIAGLTGDASRGHTVFVATCSSCHKVAGAGNDIGPELTGIGKKFDKTALLDAIVNPSASIVFGYEPWLVNTKDGESIFGFLIAENKQSLVIKDVTGKKHVIAQDKISSKKKQAYSLMPDPSTTGLTEQQLADVVAYLLSIKQ